MQGKVEICGVNTAKLPVLKAGETRELLLKAHAGDIEAREKLISGNLRLVLSVVQKFANRGESMDDLFQVGCIGLIKAIDCFDLNQNVQFSTYGVPMTIGRGEIIIFFEISRKFEREDKQPSRSYYSISRPIFQANQTAAKRTAITIFACLLFLTGRKNAVIFANTIAILFLI